MSFASRPLFLLSSHFLPVIWPLGMQQTNSKVLDTKSCHLLQSLCHYQSLLLPGRSEEEESLKLPLLSHLPIDRVLQRIHYRWIG